MAGIDCPTLRVRLASVGVSRELYRVVGERAHLDVIRAAAAGPVASSACGHVARNRMVCVADVGHAAGRHYYRTAVAS